jgi:uncharacterized protein (TIGR00251 family)
LSAWYQWQQGTLVLQLRIQPRASRDEIVGPYGDSLKVRITAPPVDGRANAYLVNFLARAFGVSHSAVELLNGESGRNKRVRICEPQTLPHQANIQPE